MDLGTAPDSLTDEELWEQHFLLRRPGGWHRLLARFRKRLWHHAYLMASNNRYSHDTSREIADEFCQWCETVGPAERKFARFQPERGYRLSTYFRHIRNSLWAGFYKRHLREQIDRKHPGSHGAFEPAPDGEAEPGRLPVLAGDDPSQEETVILRQTVAELKEAVQDLSGEDALLVESLHFVALGGSFGKTAMRFLQNDRAEDAKAFAERVESFHDADDAAGLRQFLAEFFGITVNALYVRDHRVRAQLRRVLTREEWDESA